MKGLLATIIFISALTVEAQVNSVVRGRVTDQFDKPLPGATVSLQPSLTTTSDESGTYSMSIPAGRYTIKVTFTGFKTEKHELLVIAGKQSVVNFRLMPGETLLDVVEISGGARELSGLQSLSIEKALRIPANYLDPVRALTAYPGVIATSDQNNSIMVRGNSPNGLLWRLNGLDIVNPNHLSNAGTLSDRPAANGGGVNILSAQMLGHTDLYAGYIPARYGNTLAGVIDMSMRDGNRNNFEYTAQASLIGLDLAAEGPISKSGTTSMIANYRYSTVGLLSSVGVNFGDEEIAFQDVSFSIADAKPSGERLAFFGFFGDSRNQFDRKKPAEWQEDKDRYNIDFDALTYGLGWTYEKPTRSGKLKMGAAWSSSDQEREAIVSDEIPHLQKTLVRDQYATENGLFSSSIGYDMEIGDKSMLRFGVMTNYISSTYDVLRAKACIICASQEVNAVKGTMEGLLLQPFVSWHSQIGKFVSLDMGTRFLYFTYNDTKSIEPRLNFTIDRHQRSEWNVGYSLISQQQLSQVYLTPGNSLLDFTRSHHLDASHRYKISDMAFVRTGAFYQYIFDIPVERTSSSFSALNLLEALPPDDLISSGTGKNYGVDISVENHFFERSYLIAGGTYYESKYTGSDQIERNTPFNGNFTLNGVYGTEWNKPSRNRTIAFNSRVLYIGGLRFSTIDIPESQSSGETIYNTSDPYTQRLEDYFRIDFRISFRKNKAGYTRTLALDVQNVFGKENEAYPYYDFMQEKVIMKRHLGIIPIIVYRIDF
ncbi:MAG TPA: TonB-dependent receptor [Chryseosolibacter sp.]|nr:TonB-dependent receptor [Chryseosolibacter sp.]